MAVIFDRIIAHEEIRKHLMRAFQTEGRAAHALLFGGPSGVGKKLMALAWAQGLLCQGKKPPCGSCSSCLRTEKWQHPDLLLIDQQEAATIKIEQIREIQNFISLRAFEGHSKVVIIDEAQALTTQSANALLKTLEEPPAGSYFVLVSSNASALPITIQSRTQKVLFGSLTPAQLKELVPGHADWIYSLAQGRVDIVNKLSNQVFINLRAEALKGLRSMADAGTYEGFMMLVPLLEDRESALFSTQCWAQWIKNAAASKLNVKVNGPPDEADALAILEQNFSTRNLLLLGQKIFQLEQDIQANINKNLAFEKFWLDAQRLRGEQSLG